MAVSSEKAFNESEAEPAREAGTDSDVSGCETAFSPAVEGDPEKTHAREQSQGERPASFSFGDVPDGGLQAWLVVAGTWCTGFCSFGWINSVGAFQEYYEVGPLKNYSASTIAWIPSLQIFFMMAMGPIVGRLFDSYGPRLIILAGTLLHVFGLMMASISTEYYQLLLSQGVCSAIGVAAIFQPALSCIPGWFEVRRGTAYGVLATGSSIGGVVFPIMVSRLIASVGYGWAMRACAFVILGLLAIANVTVRSRMHTHPQFRRGGGRTNGALTSTQMLAPFRELPFAFLIIGMWLLTFGIYIPITYLSVQAEATGNVDSNLASYLLSILNAGSLFGRLLSGWAADKVGKYNVFIVSCTGTGIIILGLWIPGNSRSAIIAFSVLYGFFSGAYVSLIASLVAHISPPKEIGFRTGIVFLASAIPGLVTSPIGGAILANGSWTDVKIFAGVFILAGTVAIAVTRYALVGPKFLAVC